MADKKHPLRKILIVDSNENTLKILRENLEKENYKVLNALQGTTALDMVNKEKPDLIISDVFLPEMNGFELCQRIRDTSAIPMVPFIFFTSIDDMLTEIRGFRAGANDYLVKRHTKRQDLLLRIENLLNNINAFEKARSTIQDGFLGKLDDVTLLEILQLLNNTMKTGRLVVSDGANEGVIYFMNGQIFNAELHSLRGEDAIYEAIHWKKGFFRFSSEEILHQNYILTPTTKILNKCRRLLNKD